MIFLYFSANHFILFIEIDLKKKLKRLYYQLDGTSYLDMMLSF